MTKNLVPIAHLIPGNSPEYPILKKPQYISLFGDLIFYHDDLSSYYNMFINKHNEMDQDVESEVAKLRSYIQNSSTAALDADQQEFLNIRVSRMRQSIFDKDLVLKRTKYFASSMLVLSIWAMIEQFTGKALVQVESENGISYREPPHIWNDKIARFGALSIDITSHKSYPDINECRVLNNKIKHVGVVDRALTEFSHFATLQGEKFENIEFDLQRYFVQSFEYIGSVFELCDK